MMNSLSTDFLIRIKNGSRAGRKSITAPASKFCLSIAEILKKHGFIADYSVEGETVKTIDIKLAYNGNDPAITDIKLFSKPGRRYYEKSSSMPYGQTTNSLIIISTSSGLISQRQAKAKRLGGEVIAEII